MTLSMITRNCGTYFYPNGYGVLVKHNGSGFVATMLKGSYENHVTYRSETIGNLDGNRLFHVKRYISTLKP